MMRRTDISKLGLSLISAVFVLSLVACGGGSGSGGCDGPELNYTELQKIRNSVFSSGPTAGLVVPNPIVASSSASARSSDPQVFSFASAISLPGLSNENRLENRFLKIRIKEINDPVSQLATPNSRGAFAFSVDDIRYSETMAYYGVQAMTQYVETLGFSVVKTRPLYVMVRAATNNPNEINAIYDHHYLDPESPRTMRLFGDTEFAPGMDRDMYWHEFGHLFNESASREVGMDFAGDNGAIFTEGAALHECLADALAESVSDTPTIGRWIARNLQGFSAGEPLRSAVDPKGAKSTFSNVIFSDGTGQSPERYIVAEWCTRLLWDIRTQFVQGSSSTGAIDYERMLFSAVSLLKRDASIAELKARMIEADDQLHCGGHQDAIKNAFSSRGFPEDSQQLPSPLQATAEPVGLNITDSGAQLVNPAPGGTVVFAMRIRNNSSVVARNVRVRLETDDQGLFPTTYLQGYGDLKPGQTIEVGERGMDFGFSVFGEIDQRVRSGSRIRYQLRVMPENGEATVLSGTINL